MSTKVIDFIKRELESKLPQSLYFQIIRIYRYSRHPRATLLSAYEEGSSALAYAKRKLGDIINLYIFSHLRVIAFLWKYRLVLGTNILTDWRKLGDLLTWQWWLVENRRLVGPYLSFDKNSNALSFHVEVGGVPGQVMPKYISKADAICLLNNDSIRQFSYEYSDQWSLLPEPIVNKNLDCSFLLAYKEEIFAKFLKIPIEK